MSWLHEADATREDIEVKLKSGSTYPDGRFAVRKRDNEGEFVLSVNYRGKPTHHLCTTVDGAIRINKKDYGQGWSTIQEAIDALRTAPPSGWPVKLTSIGGEPHDGGGGGSGGGGGAKKSPRKSQGGGKPTVKQVVHGEMSKADANALAKKHLGTTDGNFFVRKRDSEGGKSYILTVIYKGNPTQHLVEMGGEGTLLVNKKDSGSKGIMNLLGKLRKKLPFWPVPLKEYLNTNMEVVTMTSGPRPSTSSTGSGGTVKKKSIRKPAAKTSSSSDYLHKAMSKPQADELMKNDGPMEDGKFFVRYRGSEFPKDFVMCVVYKGRPTHHLITTTGSGELLINKKPTGGSKSVDELVEYLRQPGRPAWPVPLKSHVSSGAGSGKSESKPKPVVKEEPKPQVEEKEEEEEEEEKEATKENKKNEEKKTEVKKKEVKKKTQPKKETAEVVDEETEKEVVAEEVVETPQEKQERERKEREAARAKELMQDPNKLWVKGQKIEVTVTRKTLANDFGFSIGSKFRIAGRAKVITRVRQQSPAASVLQVGDEFLSLMGEPVFDWELDDVKLALRNLGLGFKALIFRPRPEELKGPKAPDLQPKLPSEEELLKRQKTKRTKQQSPSVMFVYRNGVKVKASSSVYCPCRNRYPSEIKALREQERIEMQIQKRLLKSQRGAKMATIVKDTTYNKIFEDSMA